LETLERIEEGRVESADSEDALAAIDDSYIPGGAQAPADAGAGTFRREGG